MVDRRNEPNNIIEARCERKHIGGKQYLNLRTQMKILLLLLLVLQSYAWHIDTQCRKYLGWEYYSIFPQASCHVGAQVQPLKILQRLFDSPERDDWTQNACGNTLEI